MCLNFPEDTDFVHIANREPCVASAIKLTARGRDLHMHRFPHSTRKPQNSTCQRNCLPENLNCHLKKEQVFIYCESRWHLQGGFEKAYLDLWRAASVDSTNQVHQMFRLAQLLHIGLEDPGVQSCQVTLRSMWTLPAEILETKSIIFDFQRINSLVIHGASFKWRLASQSSKYVGRDTIFQRRPLGLLHFWNNHS